MLDSFSLIYDRFLPKLILHQFYVLPINVPLDANTLGLMTSLVNKIILIINTSSSGLDGKRNITINMSTDH